MHDTALIEDLALILCLAGVVAILFQKIKQPTVLGYLIAGLIVGPYTPPFSLLEDEADIKILAELGVIFLMFSLGLEFSFQKLKKVGFASLIIGVVEVVLMLIIGYFVGRLIGWSAYDSVLLGAALSISSTTIIIKALEELDLKRQSFAEVMVGVLLIEDMLAILLMVFISTTLGEENLFSSKILSAAVQLFFVVTSWFLIGYFIIPYMMRKIQKYINYETLTILSIGLCLFLSSVAIYFHYSAALGAFIMGSILAETQQVHTIEKLTLPIRDMFAAVFFVSVGMLIDPFLIIQYWPYVLLLTFVTILGKILTSGLGALISGQSVSTSIKLGFGMAQIGEFSFIIVGLGGSMFVTTESLYPIIVAISAITTFSTPYLIRFSQVFSEKVEKNLPQSFQNGLKMYDHVMNYFYKKASKIRWSDVIRFVLNAIVVATLFSIALDFLIPKYFSKPDWHGLLICFITLLAASPFIWGMLFATDSRKAWYFSGARSIAWILAAGELLFIMYWHIKMIDMGIIGAISILFFIFCYPFIQTCYYFFENQLVKSLSKANKKEDLLHELSPWDFEVARLELLGHFPFFGKTLREAGMVPAKGIHVIALNRDQKTIWFPDLEEHIQKLDELVVLGDSDEIDQLEDSAKKLDDDDNL